ncbi:MAG: DUF4349 domain-containing protein [Oscillospiraceae bacterium]|jgi:hypothetical protein|nr:DUF4349 domain-containing protein [Oscillospiraceae bacterium]
MKHRFIALLITSALILALAACSAGYDTTAVNGDRGNGAVMPPQNVSKGPVADSAAIEGGFGYDMSAEAAPQAPGYISGAKEPPASDGRKLIKSASYSIESTDFDASLTALDGIAAMFGGYVQDSSVSGGTALYGSYMLKTAYYTLRVPSASFEAALQSVGNIGNVTDKSSNTQDISDVYYDTETRIKTTKTKIDRLTLLLEQADNMENIIQLENALSNATYELESLTGTLKSYDRQVDYSIISVYLHEVAKVSDPVKPPPVTLSERVALAFRNGFDGMVRTLENLLVWAAESVFGIIIFLAAVVIIVLCVRRSRRKRAKAVTAKFETEKDAE